MSNKWKDFEYFSADEPNPIGKYTQPKPNPRAGRGGGYPDDEMDLTGTKTRGRWIEPYGKKKDRMDIRGTGAAERGKRFFVDDIDYTPTKTSGRKQVSSKD